MSQSSKESLDSDLKDQSLIYSSSSSSSSDNDKNLLPSKVTSEKDKKYVSEKSRKNDRRASSSSECVKLESSKSSVITTDESDFEENKKMSKVNKFISTRKLFLNSNKKADEDRKSLKNESNLGFNNKYNHGNVKSRKVSMRFAETFVSRLLLTFKLFKISFLISS